jgi:ubiquinone/menaquinone biosynthesis C-methylase UbiE
MLENKKAELLNSKAAREESKSGEVIAALKLQKGQIVADIGAGGGYFALLFSEAVGEEGRVYIADTTQGHLDYAMALAKEKGAANLEPILVKEGIPNLPEKGMDLIFMRSVCHHLKNRAEYFRNMKRLLSPGGRVALIDYRRGPFWKFRWLFGHYVESAVVKKEMEEAGFRLDESFDFMARQWFMVFADKRAGI